MTIVKTKIKSNDSRLIVDNGEIFSVACLSHYHKLNCQ